MLLIFLYQQICTNNVLSCDINTRRHENHVKFVGHVIYWFRENLCTLNEDSIPNTGNFLPFHQLDSHEPVIFVIISASVNVQSISTLFCLANNFRSLLCLSWLCMTSGGSIRMVVPYCGRSGTVAYIYITGHFELACRSKST